MNIFYCKLSEYNSNTTCMLNLFNLYVDTIFSSAKCHFFPQLPSFTNSVMLTAVLHAYCSQSSPWNLVKSIWKLSERKYFIVTPGSFLGVSNCNLKAKVRINNILKTNSMTISTATRNLPSTTPHSKECSHTYMLVAKYSNISRIFMRVYFLKGKIITSANVHNFVNHKALNAVQKLKSYTDSGKLRNPEHVFFPLHNHFWFHSSLLSDLLHNAFFNYICDMLYIIDTWKGKHALTIRYIYFSQFYEISRFFSI